MDFTDGSAVRNLPAKQEPQETQVQSLVQEDSLEEGMQPTPVFLPGESHRQRNLAGYSPGGCKESDMPEVAAQTHRGL